MGVLVWMITGLGDWVWAGLGGGGYDTVKRPRLMVPTNLEIVTVGLDILTTRKVEGCRVGESIWTVEQRLSRYRINIGILRLPMRHTARDQALTLARGLLLAKSFLMAL